MTRDLLCEGVRALLAAAAADAVLPARGLGVVRKDGPEHAILTYGDRSRHIDPRLQKASLKNE